MKSGREKVLGERDQDALLEHALKALRAPSLDLRGYRNVSWLLNDFEDDVWSLEVGTRTFEVSWARAREHIERTSRKQQRKEVWDTLKYWLISSADQQYVVTHSEKSVYEQLRVALTCIDYVLINGARIGFAEYGLELFTEDDYRKFASDLSRSSLVESTVYEWSKRLKEFFNCEIGKLTRNERQRLLLEAPQEIAEQELAESLTDLSAEEARLARAWLWSRSLYVPGYGNDSFEVRPNMVELSKLIYPETLAIRKRFEVPPELCCNPREPNLRERRGAPVVTSDDYMGRVRLDRYGDVFCGLGQLQHLLKNISNFGHWEKASVAAQNFDLKEHGRYKLPPFEVMISSLSSALEYFYANHEHLKKSYLGLLEMATENGITIAQLSARSDITEHISEQTVEMGVKRWTISSAPPHLANRRQKSDYHAAIRSNEGLWECLCVLFGAAQVVVGMITARRITELRKLSSSENLDESASSLVYTAGKRLAFKQREERQIPIEAAAAKVLESLSDLHESVTEIAQEKPPSVFARISRSGKKIYRVCDDSCFNSSLDFFFDYINQTENEAGQRYYLRQHQMRRFFAMTFFWANEFKGLEALSSFLGHSNAEHTYRYITDSTPGAVIRGIKAQRLAAELHEGNTNYADLLRLVETRYPVSDLSLVDKSDLENYLEGLLEEGVISVEPIFMKRNRYRIAVVVVKEATVEQSKKY